MLCPTDLLQLERLERGMHVHQRQNEARCILFYRARYQMSLSKLNSSSLKRQKPSSSFLKQSLLPKKINTVPVPSYRCRTSSLVIGTATGTLDCCPGMQDFFRGVRRSIVGQAIESSTVRVCSVY